MKSILEHMKHIPKPERSENDILAFAIASSLSTSAAPATRSQSGLPSSWSSGGATVITSVLSNSAAATVKPMATTASIIDIPWELRRFLQVVLPICFVLTLLGNLITAAVMARLSRRKLSVCLYLSLLAIIDIAFVCVRAGDYWVQLTFNVRLLNELLMLNSAICSSYCMVYNVLVHLRALFHLAISVDVYLLYRNPTKSFLALNLERVQHVILILITLSLVVNSQFLWTYSVVTVNHQQLSIPRGNYCSYNTKWVESSFRTMIWPTIDIFLGDIFPLFGIGVAVGLLAYLRFHLRKRPRNTAQTEETEANGAIGHSPPSNHNLARYIIDVRAFQELRRLCLLTICAFWVVFLPQAIYYVYKFLAYYHFYNFGTTSHSKGEKTSGKYSRSGSPSSASVSLARSVLESSQLTLGRFLVSDSLMRVIVYCFASIRLIFCASFSRTFRLAVRDFALCREPVCWWFFSTDPKLYSCQRKIVKIRVDRSYSTS